MPEEQDGPPPALVQEEDPVLGVKKPEGHAVQTETDEALLAVLKVFSGQGVGKPEPAGQ